MPLPGDIWQAYRHLVQQPGQQQAQQSSHHQQQQELSHLPSAHQLQAVSSRGMTVAAAAGADAAQAAAVIAAAEDDEGFLRLLLQCEQQHLQQQQDGNSSPLQQPQCVTEQEGSLVMQESVAGQQRCSRQVLPLACAGSSSPPTEAVRKAGCADADMDVDAGDDDELYMQLLQAVEQQHAAVPQGHKVAASY